MHLTKEEIHAKWQWIYELGLELLPHHGGEIWNSTGYVDEHDKLPWSTVTDLRMVRMGGGRQNGKTAWLGKFFKEHPKSYCITVNKDMRNYFINQYCNDNNLGYHRVFTVMDLITIAKTKPEWMKETFAKASHLLIDDASYNHAIHSPGFIKMMDGLFNKNIIVTAMG